MKLTRRGLFGALAGIVLAPYAPRWTSPLRRSCLTLAQIRAVTYEKMFKGHWQTSNQWAESAFLREMEKQGVVKRVYDEPMQLPLSYRTNL